VSLGNTDKLEDLLAKGEIVETKDKLGITPLFHAATSHNVKVSQFLIAHGANINAKDNDGQTALHYAAARNLPLDRQFY